MEKGEGKAEHCTRLFASVLTTTELQKFPGDISVTHGAFPSQQPRGVCQSTLDQCSVTGTGPGWCFSEYFSNEQLPA